MLCTIVHVRTWDIGEEKEHLRLKIQKNTTESASVTLLRYSNHLPTTGYGHQKQCSLQGQ
jgi:hypothetical protein